MPKIPKWSKCQDAKKRCQNQKMIESPNFKSRKSEEKMAFFYHYFKKRQKKLSFFSIFLKKKKIRKKIARY